MNRSNYLCIGVSLCMRPANEIRRYNVTSSLIGWAHTQNDPWCIRNHPAWPHMSCWSVKHDVFSVMTFRARWRKPIHFSGPCQTEYFVWRYVYLPFVFTFVWQRRMAEVIKSLHYVNTNNLLRQSECKSKQISGIMYGAGISETRSAGYLAIKKSRLFFLLVRFKY